VIGAALSLLTGAAYTALGIITVYELIRHRRTRGFSHFGVAFAIMAFTCGPHHLLHAFHVLLGHEHQHPELISALALGVLPAVFFIGLRIEAAFGGRGDRLISSRAATALPWLMVAVSGAVIYEAARGGVRIGIDPRALIPNVILFVNYMLVGYFMARTQLARRPLMDAWSLSGIAMSAVFLTCAVSHLVAGLVTTPGFARIVLDNFAVPTSFYFLWAVHRLHRDSARDWNRRPLVGLAAPQGRRSPWAETAA
jgi:hypothetical protein